jgi:hypothetical protein
MPATKFSGFDAAAFAVYTPEKWSSMVHNLPRMRNKDLLGGLCDLVDASLRVLLQKTDRTASDEIPNVVNQRRVQSQGVFWIRDLATRSQLASFLEKMPLDRKITLNLAPQDKHVSLAVELQHGGLWVGLRLPSGAAVDRHNLQKKLQQSWERPRFLELLHGLPEPMRAGFGSSTQAVREAVDEQLTLLATQLDADDLPYLVGDRLSIDEVVAAGPDLPQQIHDRLATLAPLYRFIAWTRDNDLIDATKQIQEEKVRKRQVAFVVGDRVRIMRGPFSGKQGKILAMDSKSQVRLTVGPISVRMPADDLTLVK